ncbi:probable inactive leucine-rich repeat receptor-like protein kinase At3g03770 [Impatiens glandulifera]|uniref:probable inactive leucine-rich repeat receptor-like protein kinase At3g03770 n=1 Tax=Impatiens glandulifera TaxID=253017 RepID=UPI001FB0756F|nr:probable inactive leucine-rich repeat receptor-like protein kinase At3g03770 [Impatiens glandulifera]
MGFTRFFLFQLYCSWVFFIYSSHSLQSSQTQILHQLRKQLEYPNSLEIWNTTSAAIDLCFLSSLQVNISCQDNSVTEIRIHGDKVRQQSDLLRFKGYAIPNQTLSESFSMDSFFTTLGRLNSLRVLSLVSLGIWGSIPDKIHRLDSLEYLDLSSNFLFGSIPSGITRMVNLQTLVLDDNFFNGSLPNGLDSLSNLQILDLSLNKFDSQLPILPKNITTVSLNNNSFSSIIPLQYTSLDQIQRLDLSFNSLTGNPPSGLFSLKNISYLNLGFNNLSGLLPVDLICSNSIESVDISNNNMKGSLPSCLVTAKSSKYNRNCFSNGLDQKPESDCAETVERRRRRRSNGKKIGALVGIIGAVLVFVMGILWFGFGLISRVLGSRETSEKHLLQKSGEDNNSVSGFNTNVLSTARYISQVGKGSEEGVHSHRLFSLEELMEATNNFNDSTLMGDGSSYGKLYKGRLENGTKVVIRCFSVSKKYTMRNLKLRLDLLARLRHPHLVCFLGHCIDGSGRTESDDTEKVYLIYEYVSNGNYSSKLSDNGLETALKWPDRLAVLVGVAKAIHFLHTGVIPGFFNNRLKSNNILLNEHRMAKLSDYGFSIIADEIGKSEGKGDGVKSWQMKFLEDDIYSFGFILLESLVGPSVSGRREAFMSNEMASLGDLDNRKKIIDPVVLGSCSQESLTIAISITEKCINPGSITRPSFEDVLWNLQYAAQVQANADGEQRSEPLPR